MIKVTFDTNAFDKAARPRIYAKDPDRDQFAKVHEAVRDGRIAAFICETMIALEGIKADDRADVFGGTNLVHKIRAGESASTIRIDLKMEQPLRQELHPKQVERFIAALDLGMKLLGAPRIGMPRVELPNESPYVEETEAGLSIRLERYFEIAQAIQQRALGSAHAQKLAERFGGNPVTAPWFTALGAARDIHEKREVARAVAEWADGDSIAAHYAYGNDLFCTSDEARRGHQSILDPGSRAWLSNTYGIRFVTLAQLAAKL